MIDKKLISKILMSLLAALMILLVVVIFLETRKDNPTSSEQTPTPTPIPVVQRPVSKWATDQGVLTIEADLKGLSTELEQTDLKESNLLPPVLDMKIAF